MFPVTSPVAWQPPFPLSFLQGRQEKQCPQSASGSEHDQCPPAARAETTTDAEGRRKRKRHSFCKLHTFTEFSALMMSSRGVMIRSFSQCIDHKS